MKTIFNLAQVQGGNQIDLSPSERGQWSNPKAIPGFEHTFDRGSSFFGDDLLQVSGMNLTIADENRTWGQVGLAAGGGFSIGLVGAAVIAVTYAYLKNPR